nr:RNA-directed DNA polymerase, eukaryota, reverse transcriptase zinc-binding domain protein [Tanacetum cinerariifolium]
GPVEMDTKWGWRIHDERANKVGSGEDTERGLRRPSNFVEQVRTQEVREELDKRGIDLDLLLFPCCDNVVESCNHSLVLCDLAMKVWE